MDTTANLGLPYLAAAQAQKHVTHNEALARLDALVQLTVLDKDRATPPADPAEGERYLVPPGAGGAWTGWDGRIAHRLDGTWEGIAPTPGWLAFVADEGDLYVFTGGAWIALAATLDTLQNLTRLGLGTTADAANPLAAKLNGALLTARRVGEGGSGDLRLTLDKGAAGNVLSLLFQTGFSGRAELGLSGDDDLHLKVSADGAAWTEAFRVAAGTGALSGLCLERPRLMPASADPAGASLGELYANSTQGALRWFDGAAWARVTNLTKFAATTSFDNYVAAETWTKVQFNTADANAAGAFLPAGNRFVAPEAGLYAFQAGVTYKRNGASAPGALRMQFYRNGTPAGRGMGVATGGLVDGVTAVSAATVLALAAGDGIEVFARLTGGDGYLASLDSLFAGHQLP